MGMMVLNRKFPMAFNLHANLGFVLGKGTLLAYTHLPFTLLSRCRAYIGNGRNVLLHVIVSCT